MYWSMGETTTRFSRRMPRRAKGVNIGGGGLRIWTSNPGGRTVFANQRVTPSRNSGSRSRTFS